MDMIANTNLYKCLLGMIILMIDSRQLISDASTIRVKKENSMKSRMRGLVVGGQEASVFQWPWQAALTFCKDSKCAPFCGGVLIAPQYVLTAAHCVTDPNSANLLPLNTINIHLGRHNTDVTKDDSSVQRLTVKSLQINENYSFTTYDSDLALIELSDSANLSSKVKVVNLPLQNGSKNIVQDKRGFISGWGITNDGTAANKLRFAELPVVTNGICEKAYLDTKFNFKITDNMFCAGFEKGLVDSCDGDSGGPMVFNSDSSWTLEGIVSWGSPFGCGFPRQYGVYVRIDRFVDWITSTMK